MTDVARRVGVHPATVSRALRNDPRITPAQRERVLRAAEALGYRKNPLVAALMSARRTGTAARYHATLAFLTHYPPGRAGFFATEFGQLFHGVKARAHALGYQVEELNGKSPHLSPHRLSEILHHRGIHGVIVAPLHSIHDPVQLDWAQVSTVAIGYSLHQVPVSRVSHNHFNGITLAIRQCRAAGRKRLGLVLPRRVHEKVEKRWLAALLLDQTEHGGRDRVPHLLFEESEEPQFRAWIQTHRPDALLCLNVPLVQSWLARIGPEADDVAIVSLDRRPRDRGIAGIDQDYERVGAAAVDALLGMLHRNERGLPPKPFTLLLDGTWVDGRSLTVLTAAEREL